MIPTPRQPIEPNLSSALYELAAANKDLAMSNVLLADSVKSSRPWRVIVLVGLVIILVVSGLGAWEGVQIRAAQKANAATYQFLLGVAGPAAKAQAKEDQRCIINHIDAELGHAVVDPTCHLP